jgi:NADH-quinone oxidoreductase subunit E
MKAPSPPPSSEVDQDFVNQVFARHAGRPGALLAILQEIQQNHPRKYLPRETLGYIAERANVPLSRIYSVVTFYALFNLAPQGRHTICVCRGTACHTRGSRDLLDNLVMNLGLRAGEDGERDQLTITTPDGNTTIRTVACFGQCALAPVVEIDHVIYGHMNEQRLQREVKALEKQEPRA